jgi:pimeloyl-ACP methyl ester carboxylesterase
MPDNAYQHRSHAVSNDWRDGGHYTRLSDGDTFWRREGLESGTPIVLVHGATVPSWAFDCLVPPLLSAGFQTLRFDMYGHGASDRPVGDYSLDRFVRQTIELIDATRFPQPAIFMGHSFGGAVVAAVTALRPELVSRVILVAPMLDFNATSAWSTLFRYPVVGDLAMRFVGIPGLIRRRRRRYAHIGQSHLTQRFIDQVVIDGFDRSLLSMIRTKALGNQSSRYEALSAIDRDVLLITGDDDSVIPAHHATRVRSLLPKHSHRALKAEHNLLLTHPQEIVDETVAWLKASSAVTG